MSNELKKLYICLLKGKYKVSSYYTNTGGTFINLFSNDVWPEYCLLLPKDVI